MAHMKVFAGMPILLLAWSQLYLETATFTKMVQILGCVAENLYYATTFEFPAVIIFTMLVLRSMKVKCTLIILTVMCKLTPACVT